MQHSVHAKLVFVPVQYERNPSCILKSTCARLRRNAVSAGASRSGGMSMDSRVCLHRLRHQPHTSKMHHGHTGNFPLTLRRDSRTRETVSQHVPPDTGHTSCKKVSRCQRVVTAGMRSLWKHPCAVVSNNFSGGNQSANLLPVFWLRSMVPDGCSHLCRLLLGSHRRRWLRGSQDLSHQQRRHTREFQANLVLGLCAELVFDLFQSPCSLGTVTM